MPEEGVKMLHHEDILTYEEIVEIVKVAVHHGIRKVRITGGEPLVRKGISSLVAQLSAIPGVDDLAMTTNGIFLAKYAAELKQAGLMRINISMDTVDPEKFRQITRGGDITEVFSGIKAAREAGLSPIKINCVIQQSKEEPDAKEVAAYCLEQQLELRYIHQMNLKSGHFSVVEGGDGGHCASCNRLRLTADGKIKPCLFNDMEFNTRKLGAEKAILMAIGKKPASGTVNCSGHFYNIGG
jgi:cyclic pyranopterin phosphate synthase